MKTIVQIFAEFIASTSYKDFPTEVTHQTKRCLLDTIGVILSSSKNSDSGKIIQRIAEKEKCAEVSAVIGTKLRRSSETTSLANGIMAHALELDDGSKYATYHPGSSIIPAALAIGEEFEISGKQLIEAIILGYEVSLRIGTAINPSHYLKGFHPTGTIAVFGTTAASGKILNLDKERLTNALGIAGSLAGGINQYEIDGSMVKHLHPGAAARNGIMAAKLAEEGFTGPAGVIEGKHGFINCYSDEYSLETITQDLGTSFEFLKIYFKPYCSCRYVHYAIEATQNIINSHHLELPDIKEINVKTHLNAKQCSDIPEYYTPLHARLSIQYGIGSIIARGKAGLKEYTEKALADESIRDLAKKIFIEVDEGIQKAYPNPRPMIVEIFDRKGRAYSSRVDYAKGGPMNPMTDEDLKSKFIEINSDLYDRKILNSIINEIFRIDEYENISTFTELLNI